MNLVNVITLEGVRDDLVMGRCSDQIKLSIEKGRNSESYHSTATFYSALKYMNRAVSLGYTANTVEEEMVNRGYVHLHM